MTSSSPLTGVASIVCLALFVSMVNVVARTLKPTEPAARITTQDRNRATVLLRNGRRVTGEFEDIENDRLYLRVSRDDERRIPIQRVVVIDFDGNASDLPDAEANRAAGGQHVLVLQNSTWEGRLTDVFRQGEGGSRTIEDANIRLTFHRANGRTERVALRRVRRIYLAPIR